MNNVRYHKRYNVYDNNYNLYKHDIDDTFNWGHCLKPAFQ